MKISIIGSGNVATHLGRALFGSGHEIVDICSPSPGHAEALARQLNARAIMDPLEISTPIDLCLIAVKDDAIEQLASEQLTSALDFQSTIVAHTAGSVSMEVLSEVSPNYGVFYPFQTFSRFRETDISHVPFCLEANNRKTMERLAGLVNSIRGKIFEVDSRERKTLHLAAVFANNFTNHLYTIAEELLKTDNLSFDLIRPLILETAEKVLYAAPGEAQTGPAARGDQKVMEGHLQLLEGKPELKELYSLLSANILKLKKSRSE